MGLDRLIRRLPQSTRLWSCPWFLAITGFCTLSILAGGLAQSSVGYVTGVTSALLLGRELGQRQADHPAHQSCRT